MGALRMPIGTRTIGLLVSPNRRLFFFAAEGMELHERWISNGLAEANTFTGGPRALPVNHLAWTDG